MCGRYNFSAEEAAEIREIIREINDRLNGQQVATGEIRPTNLVPVLVPGGQDVQACPCAGAFLAPGSRASI